MYGFPKGFDGSFFVGQALEYVTFSDNNVVMAFTGDIVLAIESSLRHRAFDSDDSLQQVIPLSHSCLMQLIGVVVESVAADISGTLTLRFDHGQVLEVFDTSTQYESYSIQIADKRIVVQMDCGSSLVYSTQLYTYVSIQRLKEVHAWTHPARPDTKPAETPAAERPAE